MCDPPGSSRASATSAKQKIAMTGIGDAVVGDAISRFRSISSYSVWRSGSILSAHITALSLMK